jgi:hypothetical protein
VPQALGLFDDLDRAGRSRVALGGCLGGLGQGLCGPVARLPDIGSRSTSLADHVADCSACMIGQVSQLPAGCLAQRHQPPRPRGFFSLLAPGDGNDASLLVRQRTFEDW